MTDAPLFGILILEREPFAFTDFWGLFQAWLQDAGGFAAVGLVFYLLYALTTPRDQVRSARDRAGVSMFMLVMAVLAILTYAAYGFLAVTNKGADTVNLPQAVVDPGAFQKYVPPKFSTDLQPMALMAAGLFALLGIGQPFVASLTRLRFRRVWALSRLAFKEAIRNRLVWAFLAFLIPFMFPITWFLPSKPEDELRLIVKVVSAVSQFLLLLTAGLIAAFAIPNDVKNQNIYTIVTKPVERFEIVLGRFIGYLALMTAALLLMTTLSWVFISTTRLDERAQEETLKARVPVRGQLTFASRRGDVEGINAGREFDYRKYIGGDPASSMRAIWSYHRLPAALGENRPGDAVPCEFTFDIYRMTKGEENRGVDLTFRITTWHCPQRPPVEPRDGVWKWANAEQEQAYLEDARRLVATIPGVSAQAAQNPASILALARPPGRDPETGELQEPSRAWQVVNELAEKHGFYEVPGKEIFDYHPDGIAIPAGLFRNAQKESPKPDANGKTPPLVQVFVKCQTAGQLVGMAEGDLYFIEGERSFTENYFRAAFGLWCKIAIVLGLAVCCSTYLAGVISFLATAFLFLAGFATDHLTDLASGKSFVGGPFRAMNQLLQAQSPTTPVDPSNPLAGAVDLFDKSFAWLVRRFINLVPDVQAFSWTGFLSEGFNVPIEGLIMNLVVTVGYLLPWFILGYYLMRSREVAA